MEINTRPAGRVGGRPAAAPAAPLGFVFGGAPAAAPAAPLGFGGFGGFPAAALPPLIYPGGEEFNVTPLAAEEELPEMGEGAAAAVVVDPGNGTINMGTAANPHLIHNFKGDAFKQLSVLELADNIHDGWGGFRNITPAEGDRLRAAIISAFRKKFGSDLIPAGVDPARSASEFIENQIGEGILISNIEDSTVSWFEDNVPFLRRHSPAAQKTYNELCAPGANPVAMADAVRIEHESYYLKPGPGLDVDRLTDPQRMDITKFILRFLLGEHEADVYMTFDAAPKVVGKLFRKHPNVSGLVMPQNIGDSATTSFKQLGANPDLYKFPTSPGSARFVSQRNLLSNDDLDVDNGKQLTTYYEDEGFCSKFPFKFRFGITGGVREAAGNAPSAWTSYQNGYNQGPALDYLLGLLLEAQRTDKPAKFTRVVPATSCLRIADAIENNPTIKERIIANAGGIFLDLKREGDQDACDAALYVLLEFIASGKYVILVTIDRLCSLLARLLGIPCILHYNDTMTLYKNSNNDRAMTGAQKATFFAAKTEKFVNEYKGLYDTYAADDALKHLATFMCSIKRQIDIEASVFANPAKKEDDTLRPLLHNRLVDIFNHLKRFALAWPRNGFGPLHVIPPKPAPIEDYDGAAILAAKAAAKAAYDRSMKANELTLRAFLEHFAKAGFDTKMLLGLKDTLAGTAGALQFNVESDYSLFNYSYKQYVGLIKPLKEVRFIKDNTRSRRTPINYDVLLNSEDGYNTLLTAYAATFFDVAAGQAARAALLYQGGTNEDNERIVMYEKAAEDAKTIQASGAPIAAKREAVNSANDALEKAMAASERIRGALGRAADLAPAAVSPNPILPGAAGYIRCQAGGAYSAAKVDIFKEICSKAGVFMNRELGRLYPDLALKFSLVQLATALKRVNNKHNQLIQKEALTFAQKMAATSTSMPPLTHAWSAVTLSVFLSETVAPIVDNIAAASAAIEAADEIDDDMAAAAAERDAAAASAAAASAAASLTDWIAANEDGFRINVDDIVRQIPSNAAENLLLELYVDWQEAGAAAGDTTHGTITTILEPYSAPEAVAAAAAAAAGARLVPALKDGYPLNLLADRKPAFDAKLAADAAEGYNDSNRPVIYSLLVLTVLDDIFSGNVAENTSLVTSLLGELPVERLRDGFNVDTPLRWTNLENLIKNTMVQINGGAIEKATMNLLLSGGARRTRRRQRRRRAAKQTLKRSRR